MAGRGYAAGHLIQKDAMMRPMTIAATFVLAGFLPVALQADPAPKTPAATTAEKDKDQPRQPAQAPAKRVPAAGAKRWVDWQVGSVESRYRWVENSAGVETSNQWQHKQTVKAGFKFDPKGRYSVQALVGTGSGFVGSWDNLGPGMGEPAWDLNLRHLYVQAQPVKGLEGQWGGIGLVRGEHTEITTFDNDNYAIGGRITVKRPERLYVDELSVTAGHLGDLSTPNVFKRFDRWDEHNYTQVLAAKKIGPRVSVSADWTELQDVSTLRQAVKVSTKQWLPIDAVRFENYQRIEGPHEAWGFALSAEKAIHPKFVLAGGYADIDEFNGTLSGDRYFRGRRLFVEPKITLLPELTVSFFYGEAVGNEFPVVNEHRFDTIISFNVLKALQRVGAW
jgi:hypothetical protein